MKDTLCESVAQILQFLRLTDRVAVLSAMDEALGSFQSAFQDYVVTASPTDLPRIQKVCASLGQSWDDVLQSWQGIANATTQDGNVTAGLDPMKQYLWYIGALNGVAQVRKRFPAYSLEQRLRVLLALSGIAQ